VNWLRTIIARQAVKFYHWTDLDNLYSIMNEGIRPAGGQLGFDNYGRPTMTYFGAYFGRDESSLSHGHETQINRGMVLQGWLPTDFLQEHGEADADYIYREDNWYSSSNYPNANYDEDEDEEDNYSTHFDGIPERSATDYSENDDSSWDKSYWQKPYGAAAVKAVIPFSWVQNIRIGKRWLGRDEALRIVEPELNRQEEQYKKTLRMRWGLAHNGPNAMFRSRSWDKVQKMYAEYLTIRDELAPDARELVEEVYKARQQENKNQ